jgi:glycosyltransferase involved in cell wall biosynthesis
MKILCIAEDFPWPQHSGYKIRLGNVIRALAELGEVDCFFVINDGMPRPPCVVPDDSRVSRSQVVHEGPPTRKASRIAHWATSRRPVGLLWRQWSIAPAALRAFARPPYDVIWFSHIDTYLALGGLVRASAIVDLDTLEDFRLRLQLENDRGATRTAGAPVRSARRRLRDLVARIDVGRWERIEHRVAREVAAVVLCSEVDRVRFGEPNCVIVPNGYDAPEPSRTNTILMPDGCPPGAPFPVMTMVGDFHYEPNRDAARWFTELVLPRIRASLPNAEFRLVGRVEDVADLANHPGVNLRGRVDDISIELAEADLEVVPLHSGSGTRVKVLEAFAHRVPVVSTTVGCEGIDAVDGTHALVVDEPDAFAAACVRVATDVWTRVRLVDSAEALYRRHYQWGALRPLVSGLAREVGAGRLPGDEQRS